MEDTTSFQPATAIVTGSDSGIGRATAVALAKAGLDVGVTWHTDQQGAEATAEEIRSLGRKAVVRRLDTTEVREAAAAIDELAKELGSVDVYVNNAGTGDGTKFIDLDLDTWMQTLNTNLNGAFVCLQAAARHMVKQGRGGRIVAVTSVHELQPRVGAAAYDASKHGLGGLIKTMALELAEHGITANNVAPGEIATPMTGQTDEDPTQADRPGVPLGRPGDAREVAAVIAFLASPASSYVTGATWAVDGGMLQMGPQAGSHITGHDWRSV
ncbi:SDR family oxidoreductase [Arthrobacter sp. B3I4]|uniref:SDR family oxidoreductase n=1 Tax=Arthrobacter sp. B3I4 TaxID=3042267 RepID=UPI0027829337|nr:SDR family oxidoreductase [Arthrobacter sp. B3I4]MDQ0755032.1 NAD(P)-dependent dehydrogenase (short-subunit alcohol dehydrogenase family) [Arthrobacter sp. B3I4]